MLKKTNLDLGNLVVDLTAAQIDRMIAKKRLSLNPKAASSSIIST